MVRNNNGSDWYQSSDSDDWWTPQWVFDMLDQEFGFEIDVCASAENAKCQRFFSREDNALDQEWTGVCWMNPPYGRSGDQGIYQWMQKAHQSAQRGATRRAQSASAAVRTPSSSVPPGGAKKRGPHPPTEPPPGWSEGSNPPATRPPGP